MLLSCLIILSLSGKLLAHNNSISERVLFNNTPRNVYSKWPTQFKKVYPRNCFYSKTDDVPRAGNIIAEKSRITKRDDIIKNDEDWNEALNVFDWWNCLKNKMRKCQQSSEPKLENIPIRNIKRVCHDDLPNAQMANKSCLTGINFKSGFSEPLAISNKSPRSKTNLTETLQSQINSVRNSVITDNFVENTTDSSKKLKTKSNLGISFFGSSTLKIKNKTLRNETQTETNKETSPQKIIMRIQDTKRRNNGFLDSSKSAKPLGNFSVQLIQSHTSAPNISISDTSEKEERALSQNDIGLNLTTASNYYENVTSEQNSSTFQSIDPDILTNSTENDQVNIRKSRSLLYPNPMDSRQFHLMHGLYSGNGALMEDALRNAELQALNVASSLHRTSKLRHASLFQGVESPLKNQQVSPLAMYEGYLSLGKNNPSKRKIDIPNEFDSLIDTQIQERVNFLNDLDNAILKRREQLDKLDKSYKYAKFNIPLQATAMDNKNYHRDLRTLGNEEDNFPYLSHINQIDTTNMDLRKLEPFLPISYLNNSIDLFNNPYFESVLKSYASNYLSPGNVTNAKRCKRDVTYCGNDRLSNDSCSQVFRCMDKEELLRSLKELEELEKALVLEYEKDNIQGDGCTKKRWLLGKKEKNTPFSERQYKNNDFSSIYSSEKKFDSEPILSDLIFRKPQETSTPEYLQKLANLQNDLMDLKHAVTNLCQKDPNKDTAVFVHVNVSLALFNGSDSTDNTDLCHALSKKRSQPISLKTPDVGTSVFIRKFNSSSVAGREKSQVAE